MNLQLQFDTNGNVKLPTFILANRDGSYIGQLSGLTNVNISGSLEDDPQVSFSIYKYNNGEIISPYWDKLTNFKLVHVLEFGTWFEATVEENESDSGVLKNVTLTRLLEAELSQIHVYGLNINTEDIMLTSLKDIHKDKSIFWLDKLAENVNRVNRLISDGISPEHRIGPAFFKNLNESSYSIDVVFDNTIEPILKEYLKGKPEDITERFISECKKALKLGI